MGHDAAPTDSRSWASAVRRLALPACGGSCLQSKQRTFTDTAVEHAASDHLPIATSCGALVAMALVSTIQLAPKAPNCAANLVGANPDYAAAVGQSSYAVLDGAIPALALLKQRSSDAEPAGVAAGVGGLLAKRSPLGAGQTIGTITAWQLLASDVQQEIQEAEAVAAAGSEAAQAFLEGRTIVGQEDLLGGATVHQQQQFVPTLPGQQVLPGAGGGSSESEDPAALLERCLDSDVGQLFDDGSGAMVGRRSSSLGGEPSPRSSAAGWGSSNAAEAGGSAASGHTSGELPFSTGETAFSGSKGNEPVGSSRFEQCYIGHEELGRGAFGRAIRAERRGDGAQVCVKVLQSGSMSKQERSMAADEVRVLSRLCHPNIVAYQECFQEGGQHFIVMEYCECGDLERFLKQRKGELLTEDELMLKFVQLCLALHHVHAKGILHRDIKTNNIFCTRHGILKLGDFGVSKVMEANQSCARTMVGTPYYLSPELVQDKPYNSKSDVWALGCVLYELAALRRPFTGHSVSAIAVKILRGQYAPLPEHYSPQLQQLVGLLLSRKVDRRPTVEQVLGCEYVREHLRRYRTHIEQFVEHRRASYAHSLVPFQLDATNQQHEVPMAACTPAHNATEAAPAAAAAVEAGPAPAALAVAAAALPADTEAMSAVPDGAAATAIGQQPRDAGPQKAAPCTACALTPAGVPCSSPRSTGSAPAASRHGTPSQAASKAVPSARQSGSSGLPASPRASRFRVVEEGSGRGGGAGGSAGCTSRASRQSSPSKARVIAERRQGSSAAPKPVASPNSSCSIAAQRDGNYAASRPARKLAAAAALTPAAPAKAAPSGRSTGDLPTSSRIASGRKPVAPVSPRRHGAARRQGIDGLRRPVEAAGAASSAGKLVSKVITTHAPGSPTLAAEARRPAPGRNSTTPGSTQSHLSVTAVSTGTPALFFSSGAMLAGGLSVPSSPGGQQQLQRPEQQGTADMLQHVAHELDGLAMALALQLPGLLGQLKVLMEATQQPGQPAAHDLLAGGACWGPGTGQEQVARRAAVQECVEELQSRMACLLSRPRAVT